MSEEFVIDNEKKWYDWFEYPDDWYEVAAFEHGTDKEVWRLAYRGHEWRSGVHDAWARAGLFDS